jgi:imidazolonepropionase
MNKGSLLIRNINKLIGIIDKPSSFKKGRALSSLNTIENAYLLMDKGKIHSFGKMDDCPENADKIIEANGSLVLPAWIDSHTHIVFPTTREMEFIDKIRGLSYEEIAKRGGGILNTAKKMTDADEDYLYRSAMKRLDEIIGFGTGAVEIKSGYGLSFDNEIKMLKVIKKIKETAPIPVKANFLGAHALPPEYKNKREEYIKLITDKMLPYIAEHQLADYIDVFCDKGFFTVTETDILLKAGAKYGLKPKIHANELDTSGGIQTGVKNNAVSVDHLEYTGEEEIEVLKNSNTIPTLLPSTAFFLRLKYAPARQMIDAGLGVALASDYNPGSSPSGNMQFVISLASIYMKMLPEEAINATTINAAYALELQDKLGSISVGKTANVIITKPLDNIALIPYYFGSNLVDKMIINGMIY